MSLWTTSNEVLLPVEALIVVQKHPATDSWKVWLVRTGHYVRNRPRPQIFQDGSIDSTNQTTYFNHETDPLQLSCNFTTLLGDLLFHQYLPVHKIRTQQRKTMPSVYVVTIIVHLQRIDHLARTTRDIHVTRTVRLLMIGTSPALGKKYSTDSPLLEEIHPLRLWCPAHSIMAHQHPSDRGRTEARSEERCRDTKISRGLHVPCNPLLQSPQPVIFRGRCGRFALRQDKGQARPHRRNSITLRILSHHHKAWISETMLPSQSRLRRTAQCSHQKLANRTQPCTIPLPTSTYRSKDNPPKRARFTFRLVNRLKAPLVSVWVTSACNSQIGRSGYSGSSS